MTPPQTFPHGKPNPLSRAGSEHLASPTVARENHRAAGARVAEDSTAGLAAADNNGAVHSEPGSRYAADSAVGAADELAASGDPDRRVAVVVSPKDAYQVEVSH